MGTIQRYEDGWNEPVVDSFKARLEALIVTQGDSDRTCVLLLDGALSPVHKGHLSMLKVARQHLINNDRYRRVFGVVSPCHDGYVRNKLGAEAYLPGQVRYDLCVEAVREAEAESGGNRWMIAADVGVKAHRFMSFSATFRLIVQLCHSILGDGCDIFLVAGSDFVLRVSHSLMRLDVILIPRDPSTAYEAEIALKKHPRLIIVDSDVAVGVLPISSTDIRGGVLNPALVPRCVIDYYSNIKKIPKLIVITGPTRSGKSQLASDIVSSLKCPTVVIHQDSYFKVKKLRDKTGNDNWEVPTAVDFVSMMNDVNHALSVQLPNKQSYCIVEGFLLLYCDELVQRADVMIFMSISRALCYFRRMTTKPVNECYFDKTIWPSSYLCKARGI